MDKEHMTALTAAASGWQNDGWFLFSPIGFMTFPYLWWKQMLLSSRKRQDVKSRVHGCVLRGCPSRSRRGAGPALWETGLSHRVTCGANDPALHEIATRGGDSRGLQVLNHMGEKSDPRRSEWGRKTRQEETLPAAHSGWGDHPRTLTDHISTDKRGGTPKSLHPHHVTRQRQ